MSGRSLDASDWALDKAHSFTELIFQHFRWSRHCDGSAHFVHAFYIGANFRHEAPFMSASRRDSDSYKQSFVSYSPVSIIAWPCFATRYYAYVHTRFMCLSERLFGTLLRSICFCVRFQCQVSDWSPQSAVWYIVCHYFSSFNHYSRSQPKTDKEVCNNTDCFGLGLATWSHSVCVAHSALWTLG